MHAPSRRAGALGLAADLATLSASTAVVVGVLAAWLTDFDIRDPRADATVAAIATGIAALGLFMTWGDGGNRIRNAVRTLLVLFSLVAGFVALLLWGASTAGGGT